MEVNNERIIWRIQKNGLLQGSVLSPVFFNNLLSKLLLNQKLCVCTVSILIHGRRDLEMTNAVSQSQQYVCQSR